MNAQNLFIGIMAIAVLSCGTSRPPTQTQLDALDELVQSQKFKIESDWVYPQNTLAVQQLMNSGLLPAGSNSSGISLIGNSNVLKVSGDSISSRLPYFGERQMNVDYGGGDTTIQLKGVIENYKAEIIKGRNYQITFNAKSKSETFDVYITLTPNLKSTIVLNSASRHSIRHTGKVEPLIE